MLTKAFNLRFNRVLVSPRKYTYFTCQQSAFCQPCLPANPDDIWDGPDEFLTAAETQLAIR